MTRIYRFILTHDHGMAPCPADGLITLATCKPVIRRKASPGDWVLGFRPGSLERGLLLWAGRVQRVMGHGDYERKYRGRPDAVYREVEGGGFERLLPDYHPTQKELDRDTSAPVLLFDPGVSVYLNGQPRPLPPDLAHLAAAGRGHRTGGTKAGDTALLADWLASLETTPLRGSGEAIAAPGGGCGSKAAHSPLIPRGGLQQKRQDRTTGHRRQSRTRPPEKVSCESC